ncbi:ATP synthase F1 subunit delta [Candidatus Omnitrophota bacterium]
MRYRGHDAEMLHQRYAQALIDIAEEAGVLDKVENGLAGLTVLIRENNELEKVLAHPEIDKKVKQRIFREICKKENLCNELCQFLDLLVVKKRINILHGVFLKYRDLYDLRRRRQKVFVRTAISLSKIQIDRLRHILENILNKKVILQEVIEPLLLGGIDFKIGSRVYKLSLSNRLKRVGGRLSLKKQ